MHKFLIFIVMFVCFIFLGCRRIDRTEREISPVTIAASCFGDFDEKSSWHLSIASSGIGEATVLTQPEVKRYEVSLSSHEMRELRKAGEVTFSDNLLDEYGVAVPSAPVRSLTITIGSESKFVRIRSLLPALENASNAELKHMLFLISLFKLLQSKLDDTDAANFETDDNEVEKRISVLLHSKS